jgi:hypothetical protein
MKSIFLLAIAVNLFLSPTALAQEETPPNTGGRAAGSRGCEAMAATESNMPSLMLLTPQQQDVKTSERYPAFAWFVRDAAPQPIVFRLYQYEAKQSLKKVWESRSPDFVSQRGISVMRLPELMPPLNVGGRYLWQVELVCQSDRPSSNLFAEADFLVVEDSSGNASTAEDLLSIGLWRDVFRFAWRDPTVMDTLLRQVTTNPTELKQLKQSPIRQIP